MGFLMNTIDVVYGRLLELQEAAIADALRTGCDCGRGDVVTWVQEKPLATFKDGKLNMSVCGRGACEACLVEMGGTVTNEMRQRAAEARRLAARMDPRQIRVRNPDDD